MNKQRQLLEKIKTYIEAMLDGSDTALSISYEYELINEIEAELAKPGQEPVGQLGGCGAVNWFNKYPKRGAYLYASKPQYEPLSDDEIVQIFESVGMRIELGAQFSVRGQIAQLLNGVRAIEKRITEGK